MEKNNVICGIYKITNIANGKVYIGLSVDIYSRWSEHIRTLNKEEHKNKHLQRAWSKYGCDKFTFEILEECAKEELCDKEKYYIGLYNSYTEGYNMTLGGDGTIGKFHSKETKKKISKANKGRKIPNKDQLREINHTNKRPIVQLDLQGNVIKNWTSLLEISKAYETDIRSSVKKCCDRKSKRLMSKGFVWMWKDEYDIEGFDETRYRSNKSLNRNKRISCLELGIIFNTIEEAIKYFNDNFSIKMNKKSLQNTLKHKERKYKGYCFNYIK